MPRSHARILLTIWSDRDWTNLPMSAQWLYEALVSQPGINHAGVIDLTAKRWVRLAADASAKIISDALAVLAARRYVVVDRETEELLVRTFIRNDEVWRQPNTLKSACASARAVESPEIRAVLLDELLKLDQEKIARFRTPLDHEPAIDALRRTIKVLGEASVTPSEGYDEPNDEAKADPKNHARAGAGEGEGVCTSPAVGMNSRSVGPRSEPRGTRLPDDFAVTAEMVEWARRKFPAVDGRAETEKFVDYWRSQPGARGRKLDWVGTWRNWIRTAAERIPAAPRAPIRPAPLPTDPEAAFAELRDKADARAAARLAGLPFVNDVSPPPDFRGDPYAWEREHRRTWLDQHKPQIIAGLGKEGGA